MTERKEYRGIDIFRFVFAVFVIANHTMSGDSYPEWLFAQVLARIAVPFFLVTTGFFIVSRYGKDSSGLWKYVKKTVIIYTAAVILYLPVIIANGLFTENILNTIFVTSGRFLFEGFMYHLWYFPAAIIGLIIAWYLVKKAGYKAAFIFSGILFILYLACDNYLFLLRTEAPSFIPYIGFLAAPLFFVMGGFLSDMRKKPSLKLSISLTCIFMCLLVAEATLLKYLSGLSSFADFQVSLSRMYISIVPLSFFLIAGIINIKGKRAPVFRDSSLVLYIIHPMVIILLRGAFRVADKILPGSFALFTENDIFQFAVTCAVSVPVSLVLGFVIFAVKKRRGKDPYGVRDRSWIELNSENLLYNAKTLSDMMPEGCKLMAVVKARAYGHDGYETSKILEKNGFDIFAAATLDEAISLRKYGIRGDILILGYTSPYRAREIRKYDLIQTVTDAEHAGMLDSMKKKIRCHVKIDTGMHRLGIPWDNMDEIRSVYGMKYLKTEGIYTHFGCSETLKAEDKAETELQTERFKKVTEELRKSCIEPGKIHAQSSYGFLNYPELKFDYVRAGIALYGVKTSPGDDIKANIILKPALALKTRVALVRNIKAGDTAGYDKSFKAERDTVLAVLPIGYCDGVPRNLSGGAVSFEIRGKKAPVAGTICMDQLTVDVTDIEGVVPGDVATFISDEEGSSNNVTCIASDAGSISNEILSRIGSRVKTFVK